MQLLKMKKEGNQITVTGSYRDLLKDIETFRKEPLKKTRNRTEFNRFATNDDYSHTSFAGGTWEDVTNLKNMENFKKQLEAFKKNKLEEKITTKIDYSPKRRRYLSEHDGDYDHDKRWEIKSFNNSKKELLPITVIDVNVDMSISADTGSDEINKYGALVWSIIQLIESLGIQANINIINDSINSYDGGGNITLTYCIKKAGEYISPIALATTFQSVFYRRAIFSGMVLAADNFNKEIAYGLGRPRTLRTNKHIWFENGAIFTRSGGLFNAKEVEDSILKMVTRGLKNE